MVTKEETANYKLGSWVITLDNFISDEEADRLIELGSEESYERSSDVRK
jgi:prolyl 4-hydroxylase